MLDVGYLYECVKQGRLIDSLPWSFSALEAVDIGKDSAGQRYTATDAERGELSLTLSLCMTHVLLLTAVPLRPLRRADTSSPNYRVLYLPSPLTITPHRSRSSSSSRSLLLLTLLPTLARSQLEAGDRGSVKRAARRRPRPAGAGAGAEARRGEWPVPHL